jgi:hypothetical protein
MKWLGLLCIIIICCLFAGTKEGFYDESKFPEYHESPEELKKKNLPVYVKDATGKLVAMPWDDATQTTPFYDIRRKTSNYVPDYPESRYLSKFSLA